MWREVVGGVLVALWAVLTATSVGRFWLAHTRILPMRPASVFIQSGPYRFTRNPMYVGLALLTIAFGLLFNTYWPIVLLVPVLTSHPAARDPSRGAVSSAAIRRELRGIHAEGPSMALNP